MINIGYFAGFVIRGPSSSLLGFLLFLSVFLCSEIFGIVPEVYLISLDLLFVH